MAHRFKIVIPTTKTEEEYKKSIPHKCLKLTYPISTDEIFDIELIILPENKRGFCELYNTYIDEYNDEYDGSYTIFMHDDLEIHDSLFFSKLIAAHKRFDIVGIAGAASQNYINAKTPAWHLCLNKKEDGRGFLSHAIPRAIGGYDFSYINSSYYGPTPAPVVFVDGVFMSFNGKVIKDRNIKFNEKYTFHHYDMSACAEAIKKGATIGTYQIFGIHHGLGEFHNDALWQKLAIQFLEDYKDYKSQI